MRFVGLIDARASGRGRSTRARRGCRARWDRYALFAQRTFNVEVPAIPYEELEQLDDEGQVKFVLDAIKDGGVQIPGGIIEHQRTSYLDQRALATIEIQSYDGHVTLYLADRYHDDAIVFEPAYATRKPDGGWGVSSRIWRWCPSGASTSRPSTKPYIAEGRCSHERGDQPYRSAEEQESEVTNKTTTLNCWPSSARSWNWLPIPAMRRPGPGGTRRASLLPGPGFTRCSIRAASSRSVHWRKHAR